MADIYVWPCPNCGTEKDMIETSSGEKIYYCSKCGWQPPEVKSTYSVSRRYIVPTATQGFSLPRCRCLLVEEIENGR